MKNITLILSVVLTIINTSNAQTIDMKEILFGYKFIQNGKRLSMAETATKMETNSAAFKIMKSAKSNKTIAVIIGGLAGGFIGHPLGRIIAGEDPNLAFVGIGIGLVAIGIPIYFNVYKNAKRAVDLYNSSLDTTSYYNFKPDFKIIANGNGIGLTMNF